MSGLFTILLVNLLCLTSIINSFSDRPLMLFKFRRVANHYRGYETKKYNINLDPLHEYHTVNARRALCDSVLNARQFAQWNRGRKKPCLTDLTSARDPNALNFKIQPCELYQRWGYKRIMCLQCVNVKSAKWFVAFSLANKFMYLLEPRVTTKGLNNVFRLTGLFEPGAEVTMVDRSFSNFHAQFQKSQSKMEAVCDLGMEDILRVCSAVLVALNEDEIPSMSYIQVSKNCHRVMLKDSASLKSKAKILPCTLVNKESRTFFKRVFILLDARQPGAVFVFTQNGNMKEKRLPVMQLHARIINVEALDSPIVPDKRSRQRLGGASSSDEELPAGTSSKWGKHKVEEESGSSSPNTLEENEAESEKEERWSVRKRKRHRSSSDEEFVPRTKQVRGKAPRNNQESDEEYILEKSSDDSEAEAKATKKKRKRQGFFSTPLLGDNDSSQESSFGRHMSDNGSEENSGAPSVADDRRSRSPFETNSDNRVRSAGEEDEMHSDSDRENDDTDSDGHRMANYENDEAHSQPRISDGDETDPEVRSQNPDDEDETNLDDEPVVSIDEDMTVPGMELSYEISEDEGDGGFHPVTNYDDGMSDVHVYQTTNVEEEDMASDVRSVASSEEDEVDSSDTPTCSDAD